MQSTLIFVSEQTDERQMLQTLYSNWYHTFVPVFLIIPE